MPITNTEIFREQPQSGGDVRIHVQGDAGDGFKRSGVLFIGSPATSATTTVD